MTDNTTDTTRFENLEAFGKEKKVTCLTEGPFGPLLMGCFDALKDSSNAVTAAALNWYGNTH